MSVKSTTEPVGHIEQRKTCRKRRRAPYIEARTVLNSDDILLLWLTAWLRERRKGVGSTVGGHMINVRTRGEHEGRCEDLDAKTPLQSVEAVRSEATPGPRAAGTDSEKKPRGSRPHHPLFPGPKFKSIYIEL